MQSPSKVRPPDPLLGRAVDGKFQVTELLARGGAARIYKALQMPLMRVCVLKVLRPILDGQMCEDFQRRFFREASIASKLTHPNNVTIFDYGQTSDGVYFIAMEYLEGRTLAQALHDDGPFPEDRAVRTALQMCRGLREAHALGAVHRDIKPTNIFLVSDEEERDFAKILDFGLAKDLLSCSDEDVTQLGVFFGSPKYVAPEQIQGGTLDGRTDVYSVGVVMYEMVTGRVPFNQPVAVQTLISHLRDDPLPLRIARPGCSVSQQYESLVYRCLAKDPAHRPTALELAQLLKTLAGDARQTLTTTAELLDQPSGRFSTISPQAVPLEPPEPDQGRSGAARAWGFRLAAGLAGVASLALLFQVAGRPSSVPTTTAAAIEAPAHRQSPPEVRAPSLSEPKHPAVANVPAPVARMVTIETSPPGAQVRSPNGNTLCRATPCKFESAPTRAEILVIKHGYVPARRTLRPSDTVLELRLHSAHASRPSGRPVAGYKSNPYEDLPY